MKIAMNFRRIALVALAALPLAALAHHGWNEYDLTQSLKLPGTVQEVMYEHPHGLIKLKTPDKVWVVVLAPPSRMEARGLPKDMLVAGASVSVEGYPSKLKADEMRAERITVAGKTIDLK
jgi:hypothetical protein